VLVLGREPASRRLRRGVVAHLAIWARATKDALVMVIWSTGS
jgi:hypothetical protein